MLNNVTLSLSKDCQSIEVIANVTRKKTPLVILKDVTLSLSKGCFSI